MIEPILNRWRGTGIIFSISNYGITGVNIYALYLGLLFGTITTWYIGVLTAICFRLGESMGWGKWIGGICYPNYRTLDECYEDLEGYNFPYIHYIANFLVNEKEDYIAYCNTALFIRGIVWSMFLYLPLFLFGYISEIIYAIALFIYGIGFPVSCYLSIKVPFEYKYKYLSVTGEWETMEIYYGVFHLMTNILIIYSIIN